MYKSRLSEAVLVHITKVTNVIKFLIRYSLANCFFSRVIITEKMYRFELTLKGKLVGKRQNLS